MCNKALQGGDVEVSVLVVEDANTILALFRYVYFLTKRKKTLDLCLFCASSSSLFTIFFLHFLKFIDNTGYIQKGS